LFSKQHHAEDGVVSQVERIAVQGVEVTDFFRTQDALDSALQLKGQVLVPMWKLAVEVIRFVASLRVSVRYYRTECGYTVVISLERKCH
jgi:hypothetical protein